MKILIAVPTYDTVRTECFKCIYDLDTCGHETNLEFVTGYGVAQARNKILKKAVDEEYDKVLMVDSDVMLPSYATIRYLTAADAEVAVGSYSARDRMHVEVYKDLGKTDYLKEDRYSVEEVLKESRIGNVHWIPVHGAGLGCALVDVSFAKKKLEYPYFQYIEYPNGARLSEDLYFCGKVREKGGTVAWVPFVTCGHVKTETRWV